MLTRETVRLRSGRSWQIYSGGSGPELLWLHGVRGIDPADAMVAALSAQYRVIAPVAPGFVDLDELNDIRNIHDLVLDYDDLFRAMKLDSLPIVGHSFGAMIAAEIAAHFPDRATRLALLAPVGLWNDAYPVADLFARPVGEMDQILWHDKAARDAHAPRATSADAARNQADEMITLARTLTSITKFIWPIPEKGLRRRLPRVTAPTLILFGAQDAFVPPRYAEDFAADLQNAETVLLAGAGHMVPYEKTAEVMARLDRFLKGPATLRN
jgi:pimeloyl-ACP methyl ester carboxylesterase